MLAGIDIEVVLAGRRVLSEIALSIEPGSTVEVLEIRGATAYVHPVPSIES